MHKQKNETNEDNDRVLKDPDSLFREISNSNFILSISHTNYRNAHAGIEHIIRFEEEKYLENGVSYLHIYPLVEYNPYIGKDFTHQIIGLTIDGNYFGRMTIGQFIHLLNSILQNMDKFPLACHIHHLRGFFIPGLKKVISTANWYFMRFFIHDFYSICPSAHFIYNDTDYCRIQDISECKRMKCHYRKIRSKLSLEIRNLLISFPWSFYIPSEFAKKVWLSQYPEFERAITVLPHYLVEESNANLEQEFIRKSERVKIAYLGHEAIHKGWQIWSDLVDTLCHDSFAFYHFGDSITQIQQVTNIPVSFNKSGHSAMIDALRENRIDITFLWSVCPETYSLTMYESYAAGCYIITNPDSGNIAATVQILDIGKIFKNYDEIIAFFKDLESVLSTLKDFQEQRKQVKLRFNERLINITLDSARKIRTDKSAIAMNHTEIPQTKYLNNAYEKDFLTMKNIMEKKERGETIIKFKLKVKMKIKTFLKFIHLYHEKP